MFLPALVGFVTSFSLILAIGAQNAFILRQGLLRQNVFWLCLFASLSDAILITAGVMGLASLISTFTWLPPVMLLGGAGFLIWYGLSRLWAAFQGNYYLELVGGQVSLWRGVAILAAFTWLNPHVYIDTLGLVGTISLQYDAGAARLSFGMGAVLASFIFFFGLGYGARLLSPIMTSVKAWRFFDTGVAILMWMIAAGLVFEYLKGH